MILALVYHWEGTSLISTDRDFRRAFQEGFGRKFWNLYSNYGRQGAVAFIGGTQVVRDRVRHISNGNIPASLINQEWWFRDAYLVDTHGILAGLFSSGKLWQRPYGWGNIMEGKTPSALAAALVRYRQDLIGTEPDKVWYVTSDGLFYVMTPEQGQYWKEAGK